jgi:hypothetical protein
MNGAIDYKEPVTVRTAAILTDSYVAGTVIGGETTGEKSKPNEYNQLILYVAFTIGSLTSAQIKVEFSNDNSTYYQETAMSISGGTVTDTLAAHTIAATGNYRIAIPMNDRYVKISAKGTGTVTGSSMGIKAVLGVN